MYQQFKSLNLPQIDAEILKFWQDNGIFEKSVSERDGSESFVFYEGPPSANGQPGIHHVMARAIKDAFCRFQTMQGKQVHRKGGWDTHGLPIELAVEKELGITKEDIGKKISVDDYNHKCRETVMRFKDRWDDVTRKMGYWVDLENPYITFENDYMESVWHLLKMLYDKNYLYKGYTIQPYSPAAGTGLSSHELNMPGCYKEVKDTTVVAMFKVVRNAEGAFLFANETEDVRIMAWTTTPWTLPSNTGLTVGPKIVYVKVQTFNPYTGAPVSVVLAKSLISKWFKAEAENGDFAAYQSGDKLVPWTIAAEFTGAELNNVRYEQLLNFGNAIEELDGKTDAFRVILGDFVTTEDGTGIVHTAPSFGADDRRAAKAAGLGTLTLVDKQGKFVDTVGEFSGRYVKDYLSEGDAYKEVDVDIAVKLKIEGYAFNVQKYVHNYPHCWRTDKPVLYYPLDSWFVAASKAKTRMAELNHTINWKPESTGTGRFQGWLENLQDWNLSRSRYWGIPLPIWRTADGAEEVCIGSVAELSEAINKANAVLGLNQTVPQDLHRPYIDDVVLVSSNGEAMKRELDLIDVWFDSGAMPYAQHHLFAKEASELLKVWPADFIAEGVDQTRGWFYTLHAIAVMCYDGIAYKNVVSNGLVLDKDGNKMSKRLGNAVDPFLTLERYGADATRWYMLTNANPWDNLKFSWLKEKDEAGNIVKEYSPGIEEVQRKFFGTLFNTYNFFALYANVDGFDGKAPEVPLAQRPEIDRWVISLLNTLKKEVAADFADYEPTKAGRKIEDFVDSHLSNWYVRLCRRRFWKNDEPQDKLAAYQTLYECLVTLTKLMAPIAPFFADWLYRNLNSATGAESHESVHLALFPAADESKIDVALEQRMDYAQRISSMVLSLRKREKLRVRQPLQKILLPILDERFETQVEQVKNLILSEVNVKEIVYVKDTDGLVTKSIKPNFKTLGAKLGKRMKAFQELMTTFTQEDISRLEREKSYVFEDIAMDLEDFTIASQDMAGWLVASEGGITVALDVTLTPELEAEGIARELVNRIQNLRKDQNFDISDRITVVVERTVDTEKALAYQAYICEEVLANSFILADSVTNGTETELLDEQMIRLLVEKA